MGDPCEDGHPWDRRHLVEGIKIRQVCLGRWISELSYTLETTFIYWLVPLGTPAGPYTVLLVVCFFLSFPWVFFFGSLGLGPLMWLHSHHHPHPHSHSQFQHFFLWLRGATQRNKQQFHRCTSYCCKMRAYVAPSHAVKVLSKDTQVYCTLNYSLFL